jgi:hypothetical protein
MMSFRFEWIDGALTQAVELGHWVLLDNANLCNPTVLDRLNPLLEPEGSLLLNEAGSTNGQPRILKAHPDFRLFLAMDTRLVPPPHLFCTLSSHFEAYPSGQYKRKCEVFSNYPCYLKDHWAAFQATL